MISGNADAQGVPLGFTSTTQLDASTAIPLADPEVATDGAGNWVTAWSSNAGAGDAEIFVATSSDNGVTWSAPAAITANGIDDSSPSLSTNGSSWVLAWTAGGNVQVATSNNAGATWTAPADQGTGTAPAVDINNADEWVAAAADAGDIAVDGSAVASSSVGVAGADTPSIATDGVANWVIAFTTAAGIGVANSTDDGVSFGQVPGSPFGAASDAGPVVVFDPAISTFFVFWNTATGISMIVSTNGGATWSAETEIITGSVATDQIAAATDANGNWTLLFANTDSDIAFSTSSNNGADWGAAQLVADTTTTDGNPNIATDGSGEWIAVWNSVGGSQILLFLATAITTTTVGLDGGGGGGPCFIASAAYGTPMAQDIEVLRQMRDTYLMDNALGLFFVDTYYAISPAIADQVAQYPWAASLVRALLIPLLFVVELFMRAPVPFLLMSIFAAALIVRRRMTTRHAA